MASPLPLLLDLVPAFPLSLSPLPVVAFLESPPNNYNNNKTNQSVIELSRTQDEEVGDGTTSVIILGKKRERVFFCPLSFLFFLLLASFEERRPSRLLVALLNPLLLNPLLLLLFQCASTRSSPSRPRPRRRGVRGASRSLQAKKKQCLSHLCLFPSLSLYQPQTTTHKPPPQTTTTSSHSGRAPLRR